jgi:hypothetical protein
VRDDPRHDHLEFSPFGEDCSPLDHRAAGGMGPAQSLYQGANRVVVHLDTVALADVGSEAFELFDEPLGLACGSRLVK